jgi:hypothetical protein
LRTRKFLLMAFFQASRTFGKTPRWPSHQNRRNG